MDGWLFWFVRAASSQQQKEEDMTYEEAISEARKRGEIRGESDEAQGFYNPSPLSGEWAGESINELLGDLRDGVVNEEGHWPTGQVAGEIIDELCDAYEEGYQSANNAPWVVEEIA